MFAFIQRLREKWAAVAANPYAEHSDAQLLDALMEDLYNDQGWDEMDVIQYPSILEIVLQRLSENKDAHPALQPVGQAMARVNRNALRDFETVRGALSGVLEPLYRARYPTEWQKLAL